MNLEIEVCDFLCSLLIFKINGIDASEDDFVDKYDHSPEMAGPHRCGDMRADIIPATNDILAKYKISHEEYIEIAELVAEKVSFGCCGFCM